MSEDLIIQKMLKSKLFEYMSFSEADTFYEIAKQVEFKRGSYIMRENEEGEEFYWILKGKVDIEITSPHDPTQSVLLNTLQEGDLLGEMVLLGKNRRTASAKATSDCELISWNCAECFKIFNNDSHIGFRLMNNFAQILAHRIHEMNLKMRNNTEDLHHDVLRLLRSA